MNKLYTVKETSELLGYSIKTIRNLIGSGELKSYNIAIEKSKKISIRLKKEDIDLFLKKNLKINK